MKTGESESVLFSDDADIDAYELNAKKRSKRRKRKATPVSVPVPKKRRKTSRPAPAKKTTRRRSTSKRRASRRFLPLPVGSIGRISHWQKFAVNKRRGYRRNPEKLGNIFSLPRWEDIKSKPFHTIGFSLIGMVDTGITGIVIDMTLGKAQNIPEPVKDVGRIAGKFLVGTGITYGLSRWNPAYARAHQLGVYIGVALDGIGTAIKYGQRLAGGTRYQVKGGYASPLTLSHPVKLFGNVMGFGSIIASVEERKLADALAADGLVVAEGENGHLALASATDGTIIVSGPANSMKPVVQSVKGFYLAATETETDGEIGEDISVES